MDIRCVIKGDIAKLRERDELGIARAIDRLKVLYDPLGVLFAKGCLAAECVRDGFAGGYVRDISMEREYAVCGKGKVRSYAVPLVFELATTFIWIESPGLTVMSKS